MEIRDINKTIEVATLKRRNRRCKLFLLTWIGTSAVVAGTLAPILLTQAEENPNKGKNTGTPGTGTGTPVDKHRTGYVYGGHIYDSPNGAKTALATYWNSQGLQTPSRVGTIEYNINNLHQPETLIHEFEGSTPDRTAISTSLGTLSVDTVDKEVHKLNNGETDSIVTIQANTVFMNQIAALPSVNVKNPFIRFSLKPSINKDDFKDTLTNVDLGRYADGGWRMAGGKVEMFDNQYMDGASSHNVPGTSGGNSHSQYWYLDASGYQDANGVYWSEPKRRWGKAGHTVAQLAFRYTGANPDAATPGHNEMIGPIIYIYTNIWPETSWEHDISVTPIGGGASQMKNLKEIFLKSTFTTRGVPGTVITDPTEIVTAQKVYDVQAGITVLGQMHSATPPVVHQPTDINVDQSSVIAPLVASPWTAEKIDEEAFKTNVTTVPNVIFENGQAWTLNP